ncbi:hypothetical protein CARUB_v10006450mg [Capsella rubella]|uniref:C2H2-type domain-containing protein n=1 Tax=Capsella rubella TaxID=81985 RepID=R0H0C2_9BRAS|nr:uncharacterized protein LOC17878388 [Capsella rubella]EOA18015.1 hypothetical protein CARUB_v10006450mg [Capsella rubella]
MSNADERKLTTEEEINESSDDDSGYLCTDEKGDFRQIVLGLPALSLAESFLADETTRNKAKVAATLIVTAAEEAVGKTDQPLAGTGSTVGAPDNKIKVGRPRVLLEALAAGSGSTTVGSTEDEEPIKKAKRKGAALLTNPPIGPPKCNICQKPFSSWKAVFGHLRQHKNRGYLGFLPPPTFDAAEERSGGTVAASSDGGASGLGTGGLGIDLNVSPIEEDEEAAFTPKFDLNRSPPQDDEEQGDKAE